MFPVAQIFPQGIRNVVTAPLLAVHQAGNRQLNAPDENLNQQVMAKRSIDTGTDEWEWERVVKTRKEGGVIGGCSTRRCSSRFASGLKLGRCCKKVLDKEADAYWEPRACVRVQWRGNWADTWEPKFDEHGKERFQ